MNDNLEDVLVGRPAINRTEPVGAVCFPAAKVAQKKKNTTRDKVKRLEESSVSISFSFNERNS